VNRNNRDAQPIAAADRIVQACINPVTSRAHHCGTDLRVTAGSAGDGTPVKMLKRGVGVGFSWEKQILKVVAEENL